MTGSAGLDDAQVAAARAVHGPNALARAGRSGVAALVADVAREPMFLLLIAGAALSAAIGDVLEAGMLSVAVAAVVLITVLQERRTRRALDALRELAAPRALVIRGGALQRVPAVDLVPGDRVVLADGDRVPADVRLDEAHGLAADESLLTGESVPVRKRAATAADTAPDTPGGEDAPWAWSGSLITSGRGSGVVAATGAATAIGRIGRALADIDDTPGPLRAEFDRVARALGLFAFAAAAVLVALLVGLDRGWSEALLAGIAFGMGMLPEEIPVVLTVFFALGATRLARSRVLTRHFPAIETLGAATTLCVDKTGTLTENRMTVRRLWRDGATFEPEADGDGVRALVAAAAAASPAVGADPMDRATRELATRRGVPAPEGAPVREVALSAARPMLSLAWPAGDGLHLGVKGAVETVAAWAIPDAAARTPVLAAADALAADGLRVLAVASATVADRAWDGDLDQLAPRFEGLVAYEDPVRPEVPAAIESCRAAGIRVVVLTGDSAATARAVAHQVGLRGEVRLGSEATHLDDAGLEAAVAHTAVFARVVPELKLRLVRALQRRGEVVAMTGDGVNDAPALQAAHIGVAMGRRGTDVAREAADLVLIEDDFAAIVDAVRLGRRIHDNLEKAMRFVLAVHVPILAGSLVPPLVGWPTLLSPVHIALLELVIDPACTLAFEAEKGETDVMRRPPRRPDERVFRRELVGGAVAQGLGVAAAVLAAFGGTLAVGLAEAEARGAALTTLLVALVGLIAVNRSHDDGVLAVMRRPNRAFVWIAIATACVIAALDTWPAVGALFDLAPLTPGVLAAAVGLGAVSVLPAEVAKVARRGHRRSATR